MLWDGCLLQERAEFGAAAAAAAGAGARTGGAPASMPSTMAGRLAARRERRAQVRNRNREILVMPAMPFSLPSSRSFAKTGSGQTRHGKLSTKAVVSQGYTTAAGTPLHGVIPAMRDAAPWSGSVSHQPGGASAQLSQLTHYQAILDGGAHGP
jgi:hypothetical protein